MNTTAGRGIIKFLFVLLIIFLLMPGDIAGIHAQSKKNLFISDLHPERGKNKELLKHLKTKKREGYHIFFLGDCRQYPDHYRRIPHTAIQGNHESFFKNLPATLTLGKDILLVHGHNAEKKFQGPIKFLWEAKFFSYAHRWHSKGKQRKLFLGNDHVVKKDSEVPKIDLSLPKHVIRKATHEDLDYLKKLAKWVTKNSPETKIVIKGHDHIPYKIELNGILLYNCGAGWKGEYITQEENGKFYWHSFKN